MRKNKKIRLILFIFLLSLPLSGFSQDFKASFQKANNSYEAGNYDEAIREYLNILNQGVESGNIYYNLGNCYIKKGEIGQALVYYERAKRLMPQDSDIKANYEYASSLIKAIPLEEKSSLWEKIVGFFADQFTLDGITLIMAFLYLLIILVFVIRIYIRIPNIYLSIILSTILLIFALVFSGFRYKFDLVCNGAIVINSTVEAKFEPIKRATNHFTLSEGMKVYILSAKGSWLRVKRLDGKIGWIPTTSVERI